MNKINKLLFKIRNLRKENQDRQLVGFLRNQRPTKARSLLGLSIALIAMQSGQALAKNPLSPIKHIFVITNENRSFDSLYGLFPGANGLANSNVQQLQIMSSTYPYLGDPYVTLPPVFNGYGTSTDTRFPTDLSNIPFLSDQYVPIDQYSPTGPSNAYYNNILAINNGAMNGFISYVGMPTGWPGSNPTPFNITGYNSGIGGSITFSYSDTTSLPTYPYAKNFTLCDNTFQPMPGGSGPNLLYEIAGQVIRWDRSAGQPDPSIVSQAWPVPFRVTPNSFIKQGGHFFPLDPHLVVVENICTANHTGYDPRFCLPALKIPNIGDQLNAAGVSWSAYDSGLGFSFFASYDGTHQKTPDQFLVDLNAGNISTVSYLHPGSDHPGNRLIDGENEIATLIQAIMNSPYWNDSLIIYSFDETGGFFDHAQPLEGWMGADGYSPGPRVPMIIISPFAKKNFVDHSYYVQGVSTIKFLEHRFNMPPISARVASPLVGDLTNALDMPGLSSP